MKKVLGAIGAIVALVFVFMKWGGLIVGVLGTIAAIVITTVFAGGGDE